MVREVVAPRLVHAEQIGPVDRAFLLVDLVEHLLGHVDALLVLRLSPGEIDLAGARIELEASTFGVLRDGQVQADVGLEPGRQRGDLREDRCRRVGPVVDSHRRDGGLLGSGGVPHVVRAAHHDVAVVAPALADLRRQVRQVALRLHRDQELAGADAAGREEHPIGGDDLGGDDVALLVDLFHRHAVAAAGGRRDLGDAVQSRDRQLPGGRGLREVGLVERLLAGVVAVDDLTAEARLGDLAGSLLLHVLEVVHVGHESGCETRTLGGLAAGAGELVPLGRLEPRLVDVVDTQTGVGAREVLVVHLVRVDRRQDLLEVVALRGDCHTAVDERAAADAAALVDLDAGEPLGVEDADVPVDALVDAEAHEVADRLIGLVGQPHRALVGVEHPAEDLAVGAGGVPAAAHLDDLRGDSGLRQPQRGDGTAVSTADDEGRDAVAVGEGAAGGCGGGGRHRRERDGSRGQTCARKESTA